MKYLFLIFSIVLLHSCRKDARILPNEDELAYYLHISHTRTETNQEIDSIAQLIDYALFDKLFLGGDLTQSTSADNSTMNFVDSVFNIGSQNTYWSLGNHDNTDLAKVQYYTSRPPFYADYFNGISIVVLDTQDSLSNIVSEQYTLLNSVIDTISESTHLILLHHKLIWMNDNDTLQTQIPYVSNGEFGSCSHCLNPNNFYSDIYSKLINVQQKGIEVICLGGDSGFNSKSFEYTTSEGIHFISSGIAAGDLGNQALIFRHDLAKRHLYWEFADLDNLSNLEGF